MGRKPICRGARRHRFRIDAEKVTLALLVHGDSASLPVPIAMTVLPLSHPRLATPVSLIVRISVVAAAALSLIAM
jgi:hypothetical protein